MPRKVSDLPAVIEVLSDLDAGQPPRRAQLQRAVLHLLGELSRRAPGRSIEVRVPPLGAIQCGESGPTHRRGTPPNVVEMDAETWLRLASGRLTWVQGIASGLVTASGARAELSQWLPLLDASTDG